MLKTMAFIFYIELLSLLRRTHQWLYPLSFFLIILAFLPLAFSPDSFLLQKILPGGLWIAALFASLLSVQSIFSSELEDGHLDQLLLSQTPLSLILLAKLGARWIATELPLILITPIVGGLFHLSFSAIIALTLSLLFGTPIFILIGSLGMALTLGLQQQGMLLGILMLPLITPVLIFGVTLVQQAQLGFAIHAPLLLLAGISFFALTLLPAAIAITLRITCGD